MTVQLVLTPDEMRALDDALTFTETGRWEEENTADFNAAVRKVRHAASNIDKLFDTGLAVKQADPDTCLCVQRWPGHPCGYCHEKRTA